jgi:hypothetical protein
LSAGDSLGSRYENLHVAFTVHRQWHENQSSILYRARFELPFRSSCQKPNTGENNISYKRTV